MSGGTNIPQRITIREILVSEFVKGIKVTQ